MSLSYDVMVWHPDDVGARDDAFASGWTPSGVTVTKIDGDYIEIVQPGIGEAIIPAGETYVDVDHGCVSTPKMLVSSRDDLGGRRHWVSDEGPSTFRVNIDSPDIVDHGFDWGDVALGCLGGAGGLGYIEKTGISVDPSTYPYLVLGLEGTDKYWVEVYDGSWQTIISATPAPLTYSWVVHYIGDLDLGTITGIRLGVAEVPGATLTFDFFELHRRPPQFPKDVSKGHIYQREMGADLFELEALSNGYVGSNVVMLMNFEEDVGELVHDESVNAHVGTLSFTPDLVIYDDDETFWSPYGGGAGSYTRTISEETTIVRKGSSSLKIVLSAGAQAYLGAYHTYGSPQDWSIYSHLYAWIYGTNSGDQLRIFMYDSLNAYSRFNFDDDFTGWKLIELELANPNGGGSGIDWSDIERIYVANVGPSGNWTFYVDKMWLSRSRLLELYEDDESWWGAAYSGGSGSFDWAVSENTDDPVSGHSCINVTTSAGSANYGGLHKTFGSDQDWSAYDFLIIMFKGRATGDNINVEVHDNDAPTSGVRWSILDDSKKWRRLVLPINDPDSTLGDGSMDWSLVRHMYIWKVETEAGVDLVDRTWLVQGPAFVETDQGYGLKFVQLESQNVFIPVNRDELGITDEATVIAWFRADVSTSGWRGIFGDWNFSTSVGRTIYLTLNASNKINCYSQLDVGGQQVAAIPTDVTYGKTICVAGSVKVGGTIKVYEQGKEIVTTDISSSTAFNGVGDSQDFAIGRRGSANDFSTDIIAAVLVYNRQLSDSEILAISDRGPPTRVYVKGRYIRIALARGTDKEKIFAGVIENSTPAQGKIVVEGRCFQVIAQRATKSANFVDEDLNVAVTTIAAGLGLTFDRTEAPIPQIKVTKKYIEPFISNALDELASLPSKQTPYEAWRWKVGYGRDVRFRAVNDADVRVCTTTVASGTNLLRGILRGSDIYELANKVIAISGLIKKPDEDEWCESITDWSLNNILSFTAQTNEATKGTYGMRIYADNDVTHYCSRAIAEFDASEYDRVILDLLLDYQMEFAAMTLDIQFHSAVGGYFTYRLVKSNQRGVSPDEWKRIEIPLDHPMMNTSGSPSWTDIDEIRIFCVNGTMIRFTYYVDNIHFEVDNIQREATASGTEAAESRVFVYTDESITRIAQVQDLADGLVKVMKEAADRWVLPVIGYPDLQRGRRLTTDILEMDITGNYYIAEAEHLFGRGIGYEVWVLLSKGKFNLSLELAKTLQTDLRRESRGGLEVTF